MISTVLFHSGKFKIVLCSVNVRKLLVRIYFFPFFQQNILQYFKYAAVFTQQSRNLNI